MHVIMDFFSPNALKVFASQDELNAKRAAAGAILEATVVTYWVLSLSHQHLNIRRALK